MKIDSKEDRLRSYSQAGERLRVVGLRPTRQRLALARLLFDGPDRHVTAEKLHGEAVEANIRISLATVYNTLHQFTESGLLREITVDSSCSYFDTNTSEHHHFFHERSGHLEDISGDRLIVDKLPTPPSGTAVARVEVVIRLTDSSD